MKPNNKDNLLFLHLLKYQQFYLPALAVLILLFPFISNLKSAKPVIMGLESYQLLLASQLTWPNYLFLPTHLAAWLSPNWLIIFNLFLALISLALMSIIAKKIGMSEKLRFWFSLLFISSPLFIYTFSTLSYYAYYLTLILIGFWLLSLAKKRWLSLIPFVLASFVDLFSTFFLLIIVLVYYQINNYVNNTNNKINHNLSNKKESGQNNNNNSNSNSNSNNISKKLLLTLAAILILIIAFHGIYLQQPLVSGPFHEQKLISDLVADLGGLSGLSLFVIALSVIGLIVALRWPQIYLAYLLLLVGGLGYLLGTQTLFLFSLPLLFFSAVGLLRLWEKNWVSPSLKAFTLLLLILGLTFTTLSYLSRLNNFGPTTTEVEVLNWIKENTPADSLVLAGTEDSEYIRYYAQRQPLASFDPPVQNLTNSMFNSAYITELFPKLEENNITLIYLSPKTKSHLSPERGLLFLLKNERFKIIHSKEGVEVWSFKR